MKKVISLIVLFCLVALSLVSCGSKDAGAKIAAQKGTTSLMYAQVLKGVNAVSYDTFALAANDMKNGNIYAVVVDEAPGKALVDAVNG